MTGPAFADRFPHLHVERAEEEALFGPGQGSTAVFSPCGTYRYALTRTWDTGLPPVVWIMLNPSTATATADDPTIRRCIAFARAWKAGGIVVTNLFALRATDPAALAKHEAPVGPDNDDVIARHLRTPQGQPHRVVAAWGAHNSARDRATAVINMTARAGVPLRCLGTTDAGHPRHPLYVPGGTNPIPLYAPGARGRR